ncbi:MAG TPA: nucleotidyl transferase AbiEii/AbiGii toxin family protein [Planctomycetota bacterium]|nr:nucleotidyl transferase AbiEii/AbiGii toxin family protein [Planctomycetota bacterium]
MRDRPPADLAASVHQRLLNLSRKTGVDPNRIWTRYAAERLLYRLACSEFRDLFVLKGAMLFLVWTGHPYRPTYDLDLAASRQIAESRIAEIFRTICDIPAEPDGLVFAASSVRVEPIGETQEYAGERVTLRAFLGRGRISLQIDIGLGDAITPSAEEITFPALLDFPAPRLRACPRETVVAEKLHAIVLLGMANSRMKDYCDLFVLVRDFGFNGTSLARALKATFTRRRTLVPTSLPLGLSEEFASDRTKTVQWTAFLRRSNISMADLPEVVGGIRSFLKPVLEATAAGRGFRSEWPAGGPWRSSR